MKPRILFLVPADYDALCRKGVDRMILERDENGFFGRVVTVHPLAFCERVIDLNPIHRIYEFSLGRGLGSEPASDLARLVAPLQLIRAFRAVVRVAKAERVDLVRANDPYLMGLLGWWVSRSLRIPFCISLHADYGLRFRLTPKKGVARWLRALASVIPRFVIPRADMLLPIREHMVEWITTAGARREAIRVIPHGIDTTPFLEPPDVDLRSLLGIPRTTPVISFVGRMSRDNYADELADVIERLVSRRRSCVFLLVGEGPQEAELRGRLLVRPELAAAVWMLPFQPYERVVAIRGISTVALCLMGGFSLIEACAAGTPVITYDVEWHGELVQDGVTGFLVKEHDVDAVITAIDRLLDDPARAAAMGKRAQRVAFARHDIQATSRIKQDCYTEILDSRELRSR